MTKEIKKCYYHLDLPFSATEEEVRVKEKMLIKILRSKAIKKGKSCKEDIDKVANSADEIVEYIKKNGVPQVEPPHFKTSPQDVLTQLVCMILAIVFCALSFVALVVL